MDKRPVTLVVSRKVKRGFQDAYEVWLTGVNHAAAQFPGYAGANIIRQADTGEYVLLLWFDNEENLMRWQESEVLASWLRRVQPMIEAENIQITHGFEYWFTPPTKQTKDTPPRWKQDLITWAALCPLVYLSSLTIDRMMADFPPFLRVMISVGILVLVMSYIAMPTITHYLKPWLTKPQD
ncbi:MAG: hypothetical protein CUN56_07985 [Phototrophicales bacterium]|nr:MAG: hypothetical protein CUN56_07985 [Phototrophicales bacterium]RMG72516.1 MAG: hypothetical protein D6711_12795 [Chloroflexota bacterium]